MYVCASVCLCAHKMGLKLGNSIKNRMKLFMHMQPTANSGSLQQQTGGPQAPTKTSGISQISKKKGAGATAIAVIFVGKLHATCLVTYAHYVLCKYMQFGGNFAVAISLWNNYYWPHTLVKSSGDLAVQSQILIAHCHQIFGKMI